MESINKNYCGWSLLGVVVDVESTIGGYGMNYFSEIIVVHVLIILTGESRSTFDLRSSSHSQAQFAIITSILEKKP